MFGQYLNRYRYTAILLRQLVKTDFKLRYQGSVLGYVWSLLKPLMLFVVMYFVFVRVLNVDYGVGNSGAYLLLGLVMWTFFAEITGGGVQAVVGRGDMLRKLSFPRYILVLSPAFSALINMLLNLCVVIIFMSISGTDTSWLALLAPFLVLELFIYSLAIAFFLSATYVTLRDIGHIWDVFMQVLFYATPIFFPISLAPSWAQHLLILNPLAQTIQDLRYVLISPNTITIDKIYGSGFAFMRLVPIAITILLFILCGYYFRAKSRLFAEKI